MCFMRPNTLTMLTLTSSSSIQDFPESPYPTSISPRIVWCSQHPTASCQLEMSTRSLTVSMLPNYQLQCRQKKHSRKQTQVQGSPMTHQQRLSASSPSVESTSSRIHLEKSRKICTLKSSKEERELTSLSKQSLLAPPRSSQKQHAATLTLCCSLMLALFSHSVLAQMDDWATLTMKI